MAVTQAQANKAGLSDTVQEDTQGYFYYTFGGVRIYSGGGSPNAVIGAATNSVPLGSLYIETTTGELYFKSSTAVDTTWTAT